MIGLKSLFGDRGVVDWKPLLAGAADGLSTAVHGARVGDAVDAVPLDRATRIDPGIAELRRQGGRVYVDQVTYQIASGRIEKIWVRGKALAGLPFSADVEIERALGPSIGVERTLGWVVHHYPERSLSVAWHSREGCVEHVALGPVGWRPPVFGAADVLREWLGAAEAGLAPSFHEPADRSSSSWVRHRRVTALLRAFHLGAPGEFSEGKFLEGRPLSAYPLSAAALETGPWRGHEGREVATYPDALARLFWWLLHYRETAHRLLRINSGWLEAGHPGILTAIELTQQANEGVSEALAEVDALLLEMIAPGGEHVPEREMIARWGWPEVDLDDLLSSEL